MLNDAKEIGETIATTIEAIIRKKNVDKVTFLKKIERTNTYSRFLYDVKNASLTLRTLINIANALEVKVEELFKATKYKREVYEEMETLIEKGAKKYRSGDVVNLTQLFDFMWDSLNNTERRNLGKEVYEAVAIQGQFANLIKFDHKKSNNSAYYRIV